MKLLIILTAIGTMPVFAQAGAPPPAPAVPGAAGASRALPPEYLLQQGDEISLHSLIVKELGDKTFRIDDQGAVNLPLLGRIRLADLSATQAEDVLRSKLKTYYIDPDLEVNITSVHTQTVSILGSVALAGIHEMKGRITLLDALSMAGGVRPEAGPTLVLTRPASNGPIPLETAHATASNESVVEIDLKDLLDGRRPEENILVLPNDVISVPAAQIVYVIGNVKHAGGFTLSGKSNLTVIQALSLAEGPDPRAALENARILRRSAGHEEQVIVDLKKILKNKAEDVDLQPNDILFIPSSTAKVISSRTIEAAIQIGTGLLIFSTHF